MLVLIDNYDSFTYNLSHYVKEAGGDVEVYRNDMITADEVLALKPQAILLSPGPCSPNEAGICVELVTKAAEYKIPLMGVCLGHQSIGQAFGGQVVRGEKPMHAKISDIHHEVSPLFKDIPATFKATRYHSLVVERQTLPDCFMVTATSDDGVIQAMEHKELPLYGVQFHPESIASEYGHKMLENFIAISKSQEE